MLRTRMVSPPNAVVLITLAVGLIGGCAERRVLQRLDAPEGRKVVIYADTSWEVTQPLRYEVLTDGAVVIPATPFYYRDPDLPIPTFVLVRAGSLVGIAEQSKPNILLAIHDFVSDESWPYAKPSEVLKDLELKRRELLRALNESHQSGGYSTDWK